MESHFNIINRYHAIMLFCWSKSLHNSTLAYGHECSLIVINNNIFNYWLVNGSFQSHLLLTTPLQHLLTEASYPWVPQQAGRMPLCR